MNKKNIQYESNLWSKSKQAQVFRYFSFINLAIEPAHIPTTS